MPRERLSLERNLNETKKEVTINIRSVWRNEDIQNEVIKSIQKF